MKFFLGFFAQSGSRWGGCRSFFFASFFCCFCFLSTLCALCFCWVLSIFLLIFMFFSVKIILFLGFPIFSFLWGCLWFRFLLVFVVAFFLFLLSALWRVLRCALAVCRGRLVAPRCRFLARAFALFSLRLRRLLRSRLAGRLVLVSSARCAVRRRVVLWCLCQWRLFRLRGFSLLRRRCLPRYACSRAACAALPISFSGGVCGFFCCCFRGFSFVAGGLCAAGGFSGGAGCRLWFGCGGGVLRGRRCCRVVCCSSVFCPVFRGVCVFRRWILLAVFRGACSRPSQAWRLGFVARGWFAFCALACAFSGSHSRCCRGGVCVRCCVLRFARFAWLVACSSRRCASWFARVCFCLRLSCFAFAHAWRGFVGGSFCRRFFRWLLLGVTSKGAFLALHINTKKNF